MARLLMRRDHLWNIFHDFSMSKNTLLVRSKLWLNAIVKSRAHNVIIIGVVEVGGKEFRFTWSQELTDLCDIYEERQNGDDGDGLLVECGAAWRKLNVQRILDESTKNHVKMRSEEAERMLKSRKLSDTDAEVLATEQISALEKKNSDVQGELDSLRIRLGTTKSQPVAPPAPETSPKKNGRLCYSTGDLRPVRRQYVHESGKLMLTRLRWLGRLSEEGEALSVEPLLPKVFEDELARVMNSPEDRHDIVVLHLRFLFPSYNRTIVLDPTNPSVKNQAKSMAAAAAICGEWVGSRRKWFSRKGKLRTAEEHVDNFALTKSQGDEFKGTIITNSIERNNTLLTSLRKFVYIKSLDHAFSEASYAVATICYLSTLLSLVVSSSPKCSKILAKKASSVLPKKAVLEMLDPETRSTKNEEASDLFERINIVQDTEDPLNMDEKARDNSVVRAGSLSESGSDSDSESSSSGSDSESQSRSKAGSGSASSSDSESDVSSSSKEASDVDVDIMTSDDERGVTVQNIDVTASRLSPSPRLWRSDDEHGVVDINERDQKSNGASPALNLTTSENIYERVNSVIDAKDFPIVISGKTFEKLEAKNAESIDSYLPQSKPRSSVVYADHNKVMENQHESPFGSFNNDSHRLIGRSINEEQILMKGGSEQHDNHESVNKLDNKRSLNSEFLDEKSQNAKRIKTPSSVEATFGEGNGGRSSKISCSLSPERSMQMDQKTKIMNNYQRDGRREFNFLDENLSEHATSVVAGNISKARSSPDFRGPPNFASEQSGRKTTDSSGRKRTAIEKPIKYVESLGRANKHMQAVSIPPESEISAVKTMQVKGKDENGDFLDKHRTKNVQENGKSTDGYANGKGSILRREHSDLELGEFREPLPDVLRLEKMTVERTSPFKKIESNVTFPDSNVDINTGKCDENGVSESKRQPSPSFRGGMNEKILADDRLDLSRSQPKFMQPQSRQSSKMDFTEPETMIHQDKCAESGGKNGTRTFQAMGVENEANGPKRSASNRTPKDDSRHGILVDHKNVKESKSDKLNGLKRSKSDQIIDGLVTSNGRKSLGFSSEEENASYKKYTKDELHLRGPIKDFSIGEHMYKDYVREYREKYRHYCSLNKKLEKIRNDFLKVGDDLELSRERDQEEYYKVVEKLRQMFHQHGEGSFLIPPVTCIMVLASLMDYGDDGKAESKVDSRDLSKASIQEVTNEATTVLTTNEVNNSSQGTRMLKVWEAKAVQNRDLKPATISAADPTEISVGRMILLEEFGRAGRGPERKGMAID
ncbi:hypothetical protein KSP40_PGU010051 [Platanthera guangdongensis]|uniref:Uncharacterized protein n=1 Tax=Platanthera guangdongensis TaxID=2320717 RepID=A0ABR2N5D2_9ASPA